ncbi:MAG: diaminopimelate decarboxylase [Polaromonas sp.]|uniref:diaminopimelate decarboxylase n=1 Tax=Polaromonas sp. TaxID=1869339 RepID=UPI0017C57DC3|nr:diaminopimelate decarboxylase [Polaromonas sp.]MBA3595464.1 diaminopimelate decarboxylase [Polaromonas sp.]
MTLQHCTAAPEVPALRLSLSDDILREAARRFGTPCWVYDAADIRRRVASLAGFDVIRYAQKANSNIHLLRMLRAMGVAVDAVSLGEIERALAAGYSGAPGAHDIVFASDILDRGSLARVVELGLPVNVGSPQMLSQLGEASPGHPVWLRINPGFGSGFSRKTNTGGEWSKHGLWHETLHECYDLVRLHRLKLVGLHMHIGSGADFDQLRRVCDAMAAEVRRCPFDIQAISAGGGLPIPYRDTDVEIDLSAYRTHWAATRASAEEHLGHAVSLEIEPGRYLVGNSGYLVSEVRARKSVGENWFILADAGFNDLMRPAMYGSYHRIGILQAEPSSACIERRPTVVAGPLCEAGDVFTVDKGGVVVPQDLAVPEIGDLAVFHDCGAYCASMSSNYNSRGLAPEVLHEDGALRMIRRRQSVADLLALELSCG